MRLKIILLSLLLFIAFLAVNALCIDWDNPSNSADEMISSGEVKVYKNPTGFAPTPQAQRELEKNKSSLDWTMPSTLTGGGDSAKESRSQAQSSDSQETDISTNAASTSTDETTSASGTSKATDTELPPAQSEEANVAGVDGSWYFVLNDSVERDLAVILFQKGNDVFGAGKIKVGETTLDATVSGSVVDSALDLDVVSLGTINLYKLKLDLSDGSASGEYQAFASSSDTWTGSAEGEKTA
jgi:hypothetical protein